MRNRIALVTGGGRGIGRAIAGALAAEGARVAVSARSLGELEAVVRGVREAGGEAMAIAADLADRAEPARILDQVRQRWGPVEILVNNAGIGSSADPRPLVEFDDRTWDLTLQLNVTAPYLLTKLALPPMLERHWGRIINIASICARVPGMHATAYNVSKHALVGLTQSVALEVAGLGITANAICPGVTRSRTNDRRLEYDAPRLGTTIEELERQSSPLGRRLEPEEVAVLAVCLARDESRAINGQAINVCGGRVMS
jgi:NAD(P)-dependent dehydrogenase (short-subunit alcohol dehydrogenase family)